MAQPCDDLDLAQEPLAADRLGELGAQHLDRDIALVLSVAGEIHGRHPAAAEQVAQFVTIGERTSERGGDVGGHGRKVTVWRRAEVRAARWPLAKGSSPLFYYCFPGAPMLPLPKHRDTLVLNSLAVRSESARRLT